MQKPLILSTTELAAESGYSGTTWKRWHWDGRIPGCLFKTTSGREYLWNGERCRAYLQNRAGFPNADGTPWPPDGWLLKKTAREISGLSTPALNSSRSRIRSQKFDGIVLYNEADCIKRGKARAEMDAVLAAREGARHCVGVQVVADFLGVSAAKALEISRRDDRLRPVATDELGLPLFDRRDSNLWVAVRQDLITGHITIT